MSDRPAWPGLERLPRRALRQPHEIGLVTGQGDHVWTVAFSPDATRILTSSNDAKTRIWNADGLHEGVELAVDSDAAAFHVVDLVFIGGGRMVAGLADGSVRVWDPSTGQPLSLLPGHSRSITAIAVAPDGRRIVSGSQDGNTRRWKIANWSEGAILHTLSASRASVNAVDSSLDGRRILTAGSDGFARILDAATGILLAEIPAQAAAISGTMLSPGGQSVRTASYGGPVRIHAVAALDALPLALADSDGVWGARLS